MSISRVSMLTRDKKKNVGMFELTTDIHEASRGLFATAELLVHRDGDISIFKMAAVRHLGIVLPPYETTREVSIAGRSCL